VIGSRVRAKVVKNKVAPPSARPSSTSSSPAKPGISREGDIVDLGVEANIVTSKALSTAAHGPGSRKCQSTCANPRWRRRIEAGSGAVDPACPLWPSSRGTARRRVTGAQVTVSAPGSRGRLASRMGIPTPTCGDGSTPPDGR
jgi:hypothetical protein